MAVRPIHSRFCGGRSTPAMRAMRTPSFFLSLALLVLGVDADHAHNAAPVDHLALVANLLDRRPNFHSRAPVSLPCIRARARLLVAIDDAAARQVVRRKLDGYFVSRKDADEILAH